LLRQPAPAAAQHQQTSGNCREFTEVYRKRPLAPFKLPRIDAKGCRMSWKAISEAIGLEKGGASVRDALAALWASLKPERRAQATPAHRTVAFTIAVTTLAAKMAKADGVALPVEAKAFERLFEIPPGEDVHFRRIYDLAKQDVAGYEAYAGKLARLLKDEPEMLRSLLACLFHIAAADGVLHPAEDAFLSTVARTFGLSRGEFLSVRASFVSDPHSPYEVLGVDPAVSDAELKLRHRALVREHHPDKLAASGVPPELRCAANRRLAAINAAYDAILKDRRGVEEQSAETRP
jgi:DnaJ like chaperone protein